MTTQQPGVRARRREHLEAEILRLGRRQLGEVGAPGVSVRQVARDLGMASSAVYRYVASRDELLTRLIVQSYDALGAAAETAEARVCRTDLVGRWLAVGHAVRAWAAANPHDWALLYGSPVPGYAAPAEQTVGPGIRVQLVLIGVLEDAARSQRTAPPERRPTPSARALAAARSALEELGRTGTAITAEVMLAGITAWTLLIAAVTSEVFQYNGPDPELAVCLFDYALVAGARLVLADELPGTEGDAGRAADLQFLP